jgi:glycolate oxidase FAD binding subunit
MANRELLSPRSEQEAAEIVSEFVRSGAKLEIIGGGTQRCLVAPSAACGRLSSQNIVGVTHYDPSDLAISVRAGTPLSEVNAELEKRNEHLSFEPLDHRSLLGTSGTPTIGAVAAANLSGPRRPFVGAARDSLLGLRFVNGLGEIIRCGGAAIKNVSGLDMTTLIAGSRGSLGFITEVIFRVFPIPEHEKTFAILRRDAVEAPTLFARAIAAGVRITGAAHLPASAAESLDNGSFGAAALTAMRLEGSKSSVSHHSERLCSLFGGESEVLTIDDGDSRRLWRAIRDVEPFSGASDGAIWRTSLAPLSSGALVKSLQALPEVETIMDWRGGLIWVRQPSGADAERVRCIFRNMRVGHAALMRAPESLPAERAALETSNDGLKALVNRIKQSLDPFEVFDNNGFLSQSVL